PLVGPRRGRQRIGRSPRKQLRASGETVVLYHLKAALLLEQIRPLWCRRGLRHQKLSPRPRQCCYGKEDLQELKPGLFRIGRSPRVANLSVKERYQARYGHPRHWAAFGEFSPNPRLLRQCDLLQKECYRGCNRHLHNTVAILLPPRNGPSLRRIALFWQERRRGSSAQKLKPGRSGDPAYQT